MDTENKLMTLDGLIERLTEIREEAGENLPIVVGKSFGAPRDLMRLTMVALDTTAGTSKRQHVSMRVERVTEPVHEYMVGVWRKEEEQSICMFGVQGWDTVHFQCIMIDCNVVMFKGHADETDNGERNVYIEPEDEDCGYDVDDIMFWREVTKYPG